MASMQMSWLTIENCSRYYTSSVHKRCRLELMSCLRSALTCSLNEDI